MKKNISILIISFIFVLSCFSDTITGIVKTSTGQLVNDASVSIFKLPEGQKPLKTVVSTKDGKFKFDGLETGYYKIVASKKGFCDGILFRIEVNQPKYGIVNYEIVLNKPGSISGFVYDPDGKPVSGAKVFKSDNKYAITDSRGFYKIGGLNPGSHYIGAECSGYVKDYKSCVVEEEKETQGINFTLSFGGSIKGTVIDFDTKKPVKDARVECSGAIYSSSKTDEKGNFFIDGLPQGNYNLYVYRQGYEFTQIGKIIGVKVKETFDAGKISIKMREKYFSLNTRDWLFLPDENVKIFFNAFRIEKVNVDVYEVDLLNEINRAKSKNISIKDILMSADISGKSPVLSKKFDISYPSPLSELYDRKLVIGKFPEGTYMCVIKPEGMSEQKTWFSVSNIGFISKTCDRNSLITVFSVSNASVLKDVDVYIFDSLWNLEQQIKTNENGQFNVNQGKKFLIVRNKSFAFSGTQNPWDYGYYDTRMIYAYTDRPVYRPNQVIYFKAIPRIDRGNYYETAEISQCDVKIFAPDGSVVYETSILPSKTGSVYGQYMLPEEPPLGTYRIEFNTQGKNILSGSCSFKVLEYRKPEFSIEIKTDKSMYLPGEKIKASIGAKYYFGSPVKDTDVLWSVYSRPHYYQYYDEYEEYEDEYGGWGRGALVSSGKTKTDENGIATLEIPTKLSYQSKETYTIEVRMTDISRREITASTQVLIVPGTFEIVVSTDKYVYGQDEEIPVTISTKYYEQKKVSDKKQFNLSVSYETYDAKKKRWSFKEIISRKIVLDDDRTTIKLKSPSTGYIKIMIQGIDEYHNIITGEKYVWITGVDHYSFSYGKKDIEIITDREQYNIGEVAKILITSSHRDLEILFTIEGQKIFENKIVKLKGNSILLEIPVKQEYIPNVFISACSVRNKNFISSSKLIKTGCSDRFLKVDILPEKQQYHPGDIAKYLVSIKDFSGKPVSAEFSFGAVDESIYAISGELVPKIEDFFYGTKANKVSTGYSFYPWYYGGAGKDFTQSDIRKNFRDTAFWLPLAFTDENGNGMIEFKLPDNLTTWRSTVRAITNDTKVGTGINKVITSKPLMANLITPRFFVEDDRLLISGVIHNHTGNKQKVSVKIVADGLEILDEPEKTVELENENSKRVDWKVKVNSVKNAKITLFAQAYPYKDAMELSIPVYSFGIDQRYVFAGQCEDITIDTFFLPVETISASIDAKSYIYPSLVSQFFTTLDALAKYPYGCVEQTLNAFLPAIQVASTLKKIKIEDLRYLAKNTGEFEKMLENLPKKVSDGLIKLYNYQNGDGGWGWWPGDGSSPYTSGYVVFGLAHAKKTGYIVNEERLERGKNFLKSMIGSINDYNQKTFMLYALTYAGEKNQSLVDDIYKNRNQLNPYTLAQLCLILKERDDKRAQDTLELLCSKLIKPSPYVGYWQAEEDGYYSWINHNIEATAWGLRAILAIDPKRKEIPYILRYLAMKKQGGLWLSTKDTAACLFAFTDYLGMTDELSPDYTFILSLNTKNEATEKIDRESVKQFQTVVEIKPEHLLSGKNSIVLEKHGTGNLYYSHVIKYVVRDISMPAFDSGFTISRRYTEIEPVKKIDEKGNTVYVYNEIKQEIKPGDRIRVEIKISGGERFEYVMIEDPIPAGCEVIEQIPDENWWYCRREIRDEKVAFFTSFWGEKERTIVYYLRAETPGSYHVLPTKAQLMYLPEVWGRSQGNIITIEQ